MGKADFHFYGDEGRCPGQGRIHLNTTGSEASAITQSSFTKTHLMCPVCALPLFRGPDLTAFIKIPGSTGNLLALVCGMGLVLVGIDVSVGWEPHALVAMGLGEPGAAANPGHIK